MTPYDVFELDQHWFRQLFAAWLLQAITLTNVYVLTGASHAIHLLAFP